MEQQKIEIDSREYNGRITLQPEAEYGAYDGENRALSLNIAMPDKYVSGSYNYQIYFHTANGQDYNTEAMSYPISYDLPSALMVNGWLEFQVVILAGEDIIKKSDICKLWIKRSLRNSETEIDKHGLESVDAATARLEQIIREINDLTVATIPEIEALFD